MKSTLNRYRAGALALLAAGMVAGCSNPVGEGSHIRPETFAVRQNGTVLVEGSRTAITGQLSLTVGATVPVTVHFYRQGQELMVPPGYWLDFQVPGALASWEPGTQGGFTGTLRGVAAGAGTARVVLMHGPVGSGHRDFPDQNSPTIPVVVAP